MQNRWCSLSDVTEVKWRWSYSQLLVSYQRVTNSQHCILFCIKFGDILILISMNVIVCAILPPNRSEPLKNTLREGRERIDHLGVHLGERRAWEQRYGWCTIGLWPIGCDLAATADCCNFFSNVDNNDNNKWYIMDGQKKNKSVEPLWTGEFSTIPQGK